MQVAQPQPLVSYCESVNRESLAEGLFLYEGEGAQPLKDRLAKITPNKEIVALIGPEGGFSPTEVQAMRTANWEPLTLGSQVLRVETACVATISVIKYHLGQFS